MALSPLARQANGSFIRQANGSLVRYDPADPNCCCCEGCVSEDLCSSMANTPTTIRAVLSGIGIRTVTDLYCDLFDYSTTVANPDSFTGGEFCLEQDLLNPCLWVHEELSPVTITRSDGEVFDILRVYASNGIGSFGVSAIIRNNTSADHYFIHRSISGAPVLSCGGPQSLTGDEPYAETPRNDCLWDGAQEFIAADDFGDAVVEACCVPV